MRTFGVIVAVVCLAGTKLLSQQPQTDKEKIQGLWIATEIIEPDGKLTDQTDVTLEHRGDKWIMTFKPKVKLKKEDQDGPFGMTGTFILYPDKSPAAMDIKGQSGGKKHTIACIYELKGDTLRICQPNVVTGPRPNAFSANKDTVLAVYKRQKP